ncbi:MAG: YciI family protein [Pirellulales bacterium]
MTNASNGSDLASQGYYVVNAHDLDEAIGIAERIPVATVGTIEVRPILEIPGLPTG